MIEHDQKAQKFFLKLEGEESFLKYENRETGEMDIFKTYVPQSERGKGIAGKLATQALEYASKEERKVIPSCSYIADFIDRNSKYSHLL